MRQKSNAQAQHSDLGKTIIYGAGPEGYNEAGYTRTLGISLGNTRSNGLLQLLYPSWPGLMIQHEYNVNVRLTCSIKLFGLNRIAC